MYEYNQIIQYEDCTRDLNFESARKWASENNATFEELINERVFKNVTRENEEGELVTEEKLFRYFKIIENPKQEPDERFVIINRIAQLKLNLTKTDYVAVKIAEGVATKEEYADVLEQRQAWRDEINDLEHQLETM